MTTHYPRPIPSHAPPGETFELLPDGRVRVTRSGLEGKVEYVRTLDVPEITITYSIRVADEAASQKLMDVIDTAKVTFGRVLSLHAKRFLGEPLTDEEEELFSGGYDEEE